MDRSDIKYKLAEDVLNWANQELRLEGNHTVAKPTTEELRMICRHEMIPIFQHFINNVRSER